MENGHNIFKIKLQKIEFLNSSQCAALENLSSINNSHS
jgi:hypothetical protein